MKFFYSQDIDCKSILLNSIETNHCINVLRHKIGDEVNKDLTQPEKIKKFIFIDEPFSIENNLMTPTMKVRRHEVQKKYQNQIDQLF